MTSIPYTGITDHYTLIDVREEFEFETGAIPHSINKPLSQLTKLELPPGKLVFVCQNERRSEDAVLLLEAQRPGEYYTLEQGITKYTELGFELVNVKKGRLPIMRQVQVTIGSLLVTAAVLEIPLVSPLLGLGLIYAGISGRCGMVSVLKLMPWNRS